MKYVITYSLLFTILLLFMSGCADVNDDLTQPQDVNVHGENTMNPSSENFHAKWLADSELNDCQRCHAADFTGGTANLSCATPECHPTIDVHVEGVWHASYIANNEVFYECTQCHGEGFTGGSVSPTCKDCHSTIDVHVDGLLNPSTDDFHGKYIAAHEDAFENCAQCHGDDYTGGRAAITCANCHEGIEVHVDGIMTPGTDAFHANFIASNNLFMECADCHGEGFQGGIASPTCANCHNGIGVHKDGIFNPSSENFHGNFIREDNWQLENCQACHGEDYSGGDVATTSCLTCHTSAAGPEACNTCHGNFMDIRRISPPQGTANETETSSPAVGAHQSHLADLELRDETSCADCHKVVTSFDAEGHIDDTERSEVIFSEFANSGPSEAGYDFDGLTCQNTYCHGNFVFTSTNPAYDPIYETGEITGNNYSPIWNKVDGTQAACGTCHGEIDNNGQLVTPLPNGHYGEFELEDCASCHTSVVDAAGNIIDPEKHINGEPNVFGN